MKTTRLTIVLSFVLAIFTFQSCEKDDLNQPYLDQMKAVTDSIVQNTKVPGIVALVVDHKRGIDWIYAAGLSDIPNNKPMDVNHVFKIASNTKTLTGTVLLQLVSEGKLSLDDKLSKYYPQYPKADSITIKMLCNMTSGIFNYSDDEAWQISIFTNPRILTPQENVSFALAQPFYFSPGKGWYYSNTNTIILGMIIEKVTGKTLKEEIETRIIKPLKLKNTGFITSGTELPGTHGRGYYAGEYSEGEDMTEFFDASWTWAAGSAYSTPRELQKYVEALVGGDLLNSAMQEQRINDMVQITPKLGYGLCLFRRGGFYGHNGAIPGFTSSMYHSLEKDCTVIIYFNCLLGEIAPDYLFLRFMQILYNSEY